MYDNAYYVEYSIYDVVTKMLRVEGLEDNSLNRSSMETKLRNGGYKVFTSLNAPVQKAVQETITNWRQYPRMRYSNDGSTQASLGGGEYLTVVQPQAAAAVMDWHTGELVAIVHALDRTRPVLSALSFPELSNLTGFADALDLSGYNYREHFYEEDHRKYPGRVLLGSENSHDPKAWKAVAEHDYISGQFLWTGIDFLGECKGWPVRISQAGALNLAGFEKPLFALRKALWTEAPCARLAVGPADGRGAWEESFRWHPCVTWRHPAERWQEIQGPCRAQASDMPRRCRRK